MPDTDVTVRLKVNGSPLELTLDSSTTLLDLLRDDLRLTGTKYNCEQGECGACTVLVNGVPVVSCITFAFAVDGDAIETIEHIGSAGALDPIQESFIARDAAQCGYCTPGMIMAAKGLFIENAHPTDIEIRAAIEGNYCRCTGYGFIVEALETVRRSSCPEGCNGHNSEAASKEATRHE